MLPVSMSIQSASEFEAVINNVKMKISRAISERGSSPVLEATDRDLQSLFQVARQPAKLKALRKLMEKVTDTLADQIPNDNVLLEQLWDLGDYIDYRA
jgi:hypothetical protein